MTPSIYSPDGDEYVPSMRSEARRRLPTVPYKGQAHYFKGVDPAAESKLRRLLEFLDKEGLDYYDMKGPVIHEESAGRARYIECTVSIKLS